MRVSSNTGKEPPTACAKFPQTDADIPDKPYEKYKTDEDFSAFIVKQEKEKKELQQKQQQLQNPEPGNEPSFKLDFETLPAWARLSVILVPLLLIVGAAIYTFVMPRKGTQSEGEEV